ncbi:FYB1 protein, partial [Rhinopomastus cyanomelas]|nr:FYB1 protein [Rhinopomastus cyanomelas]
MEVFEKHKSPTGDVSAKSQPFRAPGQPLGPGLQARKAKQEIQKEENAISSSGPSTLHKNVNPKPLLEDNPSSDDETAKYPRPKYLKSVAVKFGVQLQATNRGVYEKPGYTTKTEALTKGEPDSLNADAGRNSYLKSAPHENKKNSLETQPKPIVAPQETEANTAFSKVTAYKQKFMSSVPENESQPSASKLPPTKKPPVNHEISCNKDSSNKSCFLKKGLSGPGPSIHSIKAAKEMNENSNRPAEVSGSHFSNITLKPSSHSSSSFKGTLKTVEKKTEEEQMSTVKNIFLKKNIQEDSSSSHRFNKINTELAAGRSSDGSQDKDDSDRSSGILKRKALPPLFRIGQAPQKPSRPHSVELEKFRKRIPNDSSQNVSLKHVSPSSAAVCLSVPPSHSAAPLPPQPPVSHRTQQAQAAPCLPLRSIKPSSETIHLDKEENYDDVEFVSQGNGNTKRDQQSDEETYEDINDIRSSSGKEKKQNREEKRRKDQQKKEQKEKEKKEQEIKKFKLPGLIQALHQTRISADNRGKNEMTVKQSEETETTHLTDNPEGKWLGKRKGCYGYNKTPVEEIDHNSLRRKQQHPTRPAMKNPVSDEDVYDDVADQDTVTSQSCGQNEAEIKNLNWTFQKECHIHIVIITCILQRSISQDEDKNGFWSWGLLKRLKVNDAKKKSVREKTTKVNGAEDNGNLFTSPAEQFGKAGGDDVYDDVDSSGFPPPPPDLDPPVSARQDTRKLKQTDKEAAALRKKFKLEGEIKILYSTTAIQNLPRRRWGSKELHIKPGESLQIIESTDDTKVLCRNEEGKLMETFMMIFV